MCEFEKALCDLRRDVIEETAARHPHMAASEMVKLIVARLERGLPRLAEFEIVVGAPVVLEISGEAAAWLEFAVAEARERRHASDEVDECLSGVQQQLIQVLRERNLL